MVLAWKRKTACPGCSRTMTWRSCIASGRSSIPSNSVIPAKSFRCVGGVAVGQRRRRIRSPQPYRKPLRQPWKAPMSTLEGLATALESVVGSAHLLTNPPVAEHAIDGALPAMVVLPPDEVQIAAVLRLASEYQATVFPRGGGSHTFMGQTPSRVDLVLSLQCLQRQLAYEPADLTMTVQAGMRFVRLPRTLRD